MKSWENVLCNGIVGVLSLAKSKGARSNSTSCDSTVMHNPHNPNLVASVATNPMTPMWCIRWVPHDGRREDAYPFFTAPEVYISRKNNSARLKLVLGAHSASDPKSPDAMPLSSTRTLVVDFPDEISRASFVDKLKTIPTSNSLPASPSISSMCKREQPSPPGSSQPVTPSDLIPMICGPSGTLVLDAMVHEASDNTKMITTYFTPQLVRDIFFQYPAVLLAYKATVLATPEPTLSEENFWQCFCSSHYFTVLSRTKRDPRLVKQTSKYDSSSGVLYDVNDPHSLFEHFDDIYRRSSHASQDDERALKRMRVIQDGSLHLDRRDVEVIPSPGYGTRNALLAFNTQDDLTTSVLSQVISLSNQIVQCPKLSDPVGSSLPKENVNTVRSRITCHSELDDLNARKPAATRHSLSVLNEQQSSAVHAHQPQDRASLKKDDKQFHFALKTFDRYITEPTSFDQDMYQVITETFVFPDPCYPSSSRENKEDAENKSVSSGTVPNFDEIMHACRESWSDPSDEHDARLLQLINQLPSSTAHLDLREDERFQQSQYMFRHIVRMLNQAHSSRQKSYLQRGWIDG